MGPSATLRCTTPGVTVPSRQVRRATDSAASSDGRYIYVEEGGTGAVAEFEIGSAGSMTQVAQVSGLPAPMEGITAS
jgi:hypothetical protein